MGIRKNGLQAATIALLVCTAAMADSNEIDETIRQYTYAWPFSNQDEMRPRGGTTKGPNVVLDTKPSLAWKALHEPGISAVERDRRAILAMAGPYRTSFDFIETIGFTAGHTPDQPYQSWGTEYVYIVADEPTFVSLQHIIVMFFESDDGEVSEPVVVKHWRQDWHYENRDLHVYAGHSTWTRHSLSRREARGTWSQAVFQVDDSPRYQAIGKWQHDDNHSSWISESTWRPLPRREFSVRNDYHVLSGTNRHTITPTGWVQEEDNLKLVLDDDGKPLPDTPYLAREAGLNRYEHIIDHDFSAGDDYWKRTAPFWADVRRAWQDIFKRDSEFAIKSKVDDLRLFVVMFEYADNIDERDDYDSSAARAFIDRTLTRFTD